MNKKPFLGSVAGLCLSLIALPVMADMKGVYHLGFEFGGDNLLEVGYTDGTSSSIDAGNGLIVAGGVAYEFNPRLSAQATFGWKYQAVADATNGDASFTRWPVDGLAQYRFEKIRLGAGMTYHLNPELDASGVLAPAALSFDDAVGTIFQLDYLTDLGLVWGVRYTDITYTATDYDLDVDGSSFGLHLTGRF